MADPRRSGAALARVTARQTRPAPSPALYPDRDRALHRQSHRAILDLTWKQIDLVFATGPGRVPTAKRRPIIRMPRQLLAALRRAQIRASRERGIAYAWAPVSDVKRGFASAALRTGIPPSPPAHSATPPEPGWPSTACRSGRTQAISAIASPPPPSFMPILTPTRSRRRGRPSSGMTRKTGTRDSVSIWYRYPPRILRPSCERRRRKQQKSAVFCCCHPLVTERSSVQS
jgi:hypothetical protein